MSFGFGFGFPSWRTLAGGFSPAALFVGGVQGAWYDPSDLTTLFTTSAGTTPVSMPGQGAAVSVGLMLDKSQGLVLGSELVTNGDFSSGTTGWSGVNATLAVVNGAVQITADGVGQARASQTVSGLTAGRWYEVRAKIWQGTGAVNVDILVTGITQSTAVSTTTPTDAVVRFVAAGATQTIRVGSTGTAVAGTTYFADNISVRALPGNHAISFNNTTARPELRARVNLLVATATLSTQSVTTQATSYTLSFAGAGSITLSGTATGSYSAGTHTITCTAGTLTLTVSGTVTTADLRPANSGALLPAYQAVVNANTYDTSGFPLYLYFDGTDDGMNVPGSASAMKFMHSALSSVCLGVNVGISADPNAFYSFFGTNAGASANVGALCAYDDLTLFSINNALRNFTTRGVTGFPTISTTDQNVLLPITPNVVFYNSDPANATAANRYTAYVNNGSALATNTASDAASTANSTYDLQIGSNGNSIALALMRFYGLVIVNATITGGQRTATQSWIAGKMGITLP